MHSPYGLVHFCWSLKNLLVLIYSKLHSKSCDYLHIQPEGKEERSKYARWTKFDFHSLIQSHAQIYLMKILINKRWLDFLAVLKHYTIVYKFNQFLKALISLVGLPRCNMIFSVQSFAIIKNTGHGYFVISRFHARARNGLSVWSPHRHSFSDFFWGEGAALHRLSGTDNPVFKLSVKIDG